jgi:type II secretory pathway pseudopilin PulG
MRSNAGFSLVESLVATALMLTVSGAVFALVTPGASGSGTQAEAVDMQQRLRVGADLIRRDLLMAGAGVTGGPRTGSLARFFAVVMPRRLGRTVSDAPVVTREDAITIVYTAGSHWQTSTLDPVGAGSSALRVAPASNCPIGRPACGYITGTDLLVFDQSGTFDLFTVTAVAGDVMSLSAHRTDASSAYPAGAVVSPAETHVYWFDAASHQLRHSDGDQTDVPVVDNVVDVRFEYFGDPNPPVHPKPALGVANCLYDALGSPQPMPVLPVDAGSLSRVPLAILGDGPWCGEGAYQFDADLLRVRQVRVHLRVQASQAMFRGTGSGYVVPGLTRSAHRALPDLGVTFDVAPRNLRVGR